MNYKCLVSRSVLFLSSLGPKMKGFVIILFCGLVYVCCAEYCTYVLPVPFIELSLAS